MQIISQYRNKIKFTIKQANERRKQILRDDKF